MSLIQSSDYSRRAFLAIAGAGAVVLGGCAVTEQEQTRSFLLKAALNGGRQPGSHPALPITANEFANAAQDAVEAGAGAIHVHVRDSKENESLRSEDIATVLATVRATIPSTPIGISTHFGIVGDAEQRQELVSMWSVLPDFASVNFNEPGAVALAQLLIENGVGVEAGLFNADAAVTCVESGLANDCLRLMMEPRNRDLKSALSNVAEMEAVLNAAGVDRPRLLHGFGATAWPLIEEATRRGYATRAGLEDTFELADGSTARDNAEIVAEAAHMIANILGAS